MAPPIFTRSRVKEVFADIAARIAPVAPLLVYLRPSDIADAIRRVHAERGEPWSSRNYAFVSGCPWACRRGLTGERAVVELARREVRRKELLEQANAGQRKGQRSNRRKGGPLRTASR